MELVFSFWRERGRKGFSAWWVGIVPPPFMKLNFPTTERLRELAAQHMPNHECEEVARHENCMILRLKAGSLPRDRDNFRIAIGKETTQKE